MKKWFRSLKIKNKLIIPVLSIMILYGIIFSYFFIIRIRNEEYSRIQISDREFAQQVNNYLDELNGGILDVTSMPIADSAFLNWLGNSDSRSSYTNINFLHNYLFNMILLRDEINYMAYIDILDEREVYYIATDSSYGMQNIDAILKSAYLKDMEEKGYSYSTYFLSKDNTEIILNNKNDKILFVRKIKNPLENFKQAGYLLVGVNTKNIDSLVSAGIDPSTSGICILDQNHNMVYHYGLTYDEKNKKWIEYADTNAAINWQVKVYTDTSFIDKKRMINSIFFIIAVALSAISIVYFIVRITTLTVTSPIYELLKSMKYFQSGDFNQYINNKHRDEIGQLIDGYNLMVDRIRLLIKQKYDIQISEKEAQLAALQSQINPHFLYNTLDLLYWKFMSHGDEESSRAVYALTNLFRSSLNKGKTFISVHNEINFLENYLYIQKLVSMSELQYELLNDSVEDEYIIPCFIVQPFVENSLVHGLKEQKNPKLKIVFVRTPDAVEITIKDSGKGMDGIEIKKYFYSEEENNSGGYAISNIRDRLRLYYGDQSWIRAFSEADKGMTVVIHIPERISGVNKSV